MPGFDWSDLFTDYLKGQTIEGRFRRAFEEEFPVTDADRERIWPHVKDVLLNDGARLASSRVEREALQKPVPSCYPFDVMGKLVWAAGNWLGERQYQNLRELVLEAGYSQQQLETVHIQAMRLGTQGLTQSG